MMILMQAFQVTLAPVGTVAPVADVTSNADVITELQVAASVNPQVAAPVNSPVIAQVNPQVAAPANPQVAAPANPQVAAPAPVTAVVQEKKDKVNYNVMAMEVAKYWLKCLLMLIFTMIKYIFIKVIYPNLPIIICMMGIIFYMQYCVMHEIKPHQVMRGDTTRKTIIMVGTENRTNQHIHHVWASIWVM